MRAVISVADPAGGRRPEDVHGIFIGCYSADAGGGGHGISYAPRDPASGRLAAARLVAELTSPSFLVQHPRQAVLYGVCEQDVGVLIDGEVSAHGDLVDVRNRPSGGGRPCHVCTDPGGQWVLVSHYGDGVVTAHETAGSSGRLTGRVRTVGNPITGSRAHHCCFLAGGSEVVVTDTGLDELRRYSFDVRTGETRWQQTVRLPAGSGPRHTTRLGRFLLVACEQSSSVVLLEVRDDGELRVRASCAATRGASTGGYPSTISTVPDNDGQPLVVVRGIDVLTTLEVGDSGSVRPLSDLALPGSWPQDALVVGHHMHVAMQKSDEVATFVIDLHGSGLHVSTSSTIAAPSPSCLATHHAPA